MAVAFSDDDVGLGDFRGRVLTVCAVGCLVAAFGLMFLFSRPQATETWVVFAVAGLDVVAGLTFAAGRVNPKVGAAVFVTGLMALSGGAVWVKGLEPLVYLLPTLVLFSVGFAGISGGWIAAAAATGEIIIIQAVGGPITGQSAATVLGLSWANVLVAWLATEPTRLALRWSWTSYVRAENEAERARQQQGKLAQLVKSLNVAQDRLEEMNHELERARHAAEDARRLKAEFAAAVSHELRTPLNLIIGFSEVMALGTGGSDDEPLPPAYLRDVDTVYRNARHLSSLIDDILDLSQIDAARLGLVRERVALSGLVAEATAVVEPLLRRKGLTLAVAVSDEQPPVYVDRVRVRQVLINLLGNAARFTRVGGVRVSAVVQDHEVLVTVADTGVGIAADDLPRVFDEFMQVRTAANYGSGSSGLGLTISKRLVELHGGSMWVSSQPGSGSTFCFTLPLVDNVAIVALRQDWETWAKPRGQSDHQRVVVVFGKEAEPVRLFQRYLDGYRVTVAETFDEVKDLRQNETTCALVLTGSAESELWQQAQRLRGQIGDLPVVICPLRGKLRLADELGVTEYLVKPILHKQLGELLRRNGRLTRDVVVIDDDPDMVRLLGRMIRLVARRTRVRVAYGGAEGLAIIRERKPDLVLLDLLMPGVDGYDVLRAMRSDDALRNVPVAVVTARGAQEEVTTGETLVITGGGGLSVGAVMRIVKASLDTISDYLPSSDPGPRAETVD